MNPQGGTFLVEAGARTAIHHHGKQETVVYVFEGESLVRRGERGESEALVRPGDFLHVPAWTPHMEINPSKEHPFRWIVVRSTPDPIVVNLPDDLLGVITAWFLREARPPVRPAPRSASAWTASPTAASPLPRSRTRSPE